MGRGREMKVGNALMNGYSGMKTFGDAQSITAHNVANSATPSFKSQQPAVVENAAGGSTISGINEDNSQGSMQPGITSEGAYGYVEGSNVDLSREMVNSSLYRAAYEANAKTVMVSDDMLKTSIDLVA
jgi:flagellar hook protein FlgE